VFADVPSGYAWGLDVIDQARNLFPDGLYRVPTFAGEPQVDLYILDSGVQVDHVQFSGRVTEMNPNVVNPDDIVGGPCFRCFLFVLFAFWALSGWRNRAALLSFSSRRGGER